MIDYENFDKVKKSLESKFVEKVKKYETQIYEILADQHDWFFSQTIGPDYRKWPDLDPATWEAKEGEGILRETDLLYESLTTGNEYSIRYLDQRGSTITITFGTSVPYSHFHQYGTHSIPARKHVGITKATAQRISEL